ncbi:hypothetical protein [Micromonospora inositola]|uniref:Uncharacterized protein n=1 Tax=Micromonospora inositola TaxID=47865 RepID=A0A1C5H880_9ACTN|nr:hypothetical protein [Micromonospora inositola]SCG42228.1 hypothetical protein GA0070613_0962 [Micromonospora inositola]
MRNLRLAVPALVVCAALSACGGQDGPDGTATPTGAAPVTSQPTPEPTASPNDPGNPVDPLPTTKGPTAPPRGGPTKPPPAGDTVLTGTIQAGVEPNCLLLDGNLLVGGPRDVLKPGAKVTVTGRSQPGMMTTCQQGTPFVVAAARPA